VLDARVIGNRVEQHAQPAPVGRGQQRVEVGEGAQRGMDGAVGADVVAQSASGEGMTGVSVPDQLPVRRGLVLSLNPPIRVRG